MIQYPQREPFFAHRYCRLLTKTCAAQDIGHIGFCLCVTIAWLEDAKRYTGPVTFYNGQLLPLLAVNKWSTLDRARKRCVEHGWLHYETGGTRHVGRYWVVTPAKFGAIPDGPVDETLCPSNGDNPGLCPSGGYNGGDNGGDNRGYNRGDNGGEPSYPIPNPTPTPGRTHVKSARKYATEFLTWYAAYPRKVAKGDAAKAYAKAAAIAGHQKLLEAVQAFAQSDVAHTEFCPYPATWLNSERYDDDPAEWAGHSKGPRVATKEDLAAWTA